MSNKVNLEELETVITGVKSEFGQGLSAELIRGDVDVLQVVVEDREEFPIYVTVDSSQILCVTYLWKEQDVKTDQRLELQDALLTMNLPIPLSAFGKVGPQYVIYGALASNSSQHDIINEIETLSNNTLDALEAVAEYLS